MVNTLRDIAGISSAYIGKKKEDEMQIRIKALDDSISIKNMFFYFEDRNAVEQLMAGVKEEPSGLEKITSSHLKGHIMVPENDGTGGVYHTL